MYECKYCRRKMTSERAFMAHRCEPMERAEHMHTSLGQAAYLYYKLWFDELRRKPPSHETFLTSAYYRSFMKLATFVKEVNMPNPEKYVELMTERKLAPALWTRNEAYASYLEWMDKTAPSLEQAAVTVETLQTFAEQLNVAPGDVFDQLEYGAVLTLVTQRKLSPWLLLCSTRFKKWLSEKTVDEQRRFMQLIGIEYWAYRFEKNPDKVRELKEIAQALGI